MAGLPVSPQAIRKLLKDFESKGERARPGGRRSGRPRARAETAVPPRPRRARHRAPRRTGGCRRVRARPRGRVPRRGRRVLRQARLAHVPAIAVVPGPAPSKAAIPYVLATDVVWVGTGEAFPLETIARALAVRLGERRRAARRARAAAPRTRLRAPRRLFLAPERARCRCSQRGFAATRAESGPARASPCAGQWVERTWRPGAGACGDRRSRFRLARACAGAPGSRFRGQVDGARRHRIRRNAPARRRCPVAFFALLPLRRSGPQPRPSRLDRAQALTQPSPRPGLDLW